MPYNNPTPRYNSNPRNNGTSFNRFSGGTGKSQKTVQDSQTDGVMLVNEKMGKFLRTRFWNRFMGIDIGTYQPGAPLDYNTVRNAQVFGHVFSFATLFELADICDEVMESIKQTNQFESTATEANQKKDVIVEISNGSNINMPAGIYLVIYKSVDTGKRTNMLDFYPFGSSKYLRGYDHNTGAAKEDIKLTGEFKKFTMMLKEAAKSFTMAQAHAVKDAAKLDKTASINMLTAISASLGIDINQSVTAATRTTGQSSYRRDNQQQNGQPQQYQRRSQPGQWSRGGQYGSQPTTSGNTGATPAYRQQQQAMAAITDEPVDINIDAATLQQVSLENFN
jgi:hypothetical protein